MPGGVVAPDGRRFKFHPPDELVREVWEGLSKAIRGIPDAIRALQPPAQREETK